MPRIRHHVLNQVRHLSCARNIVPQRRVFWYSPLHSQWARHEWLLWKDTLRGKKSQAYTHNAGAYTPRRHPGACPIPSDPSDTWHISAPMIGGTDSEALGCKTIENDPAPPLDTPAPASTAPNNTHERQDLASLACPNSGTLHPASSEHCWQQRVGPRGARVLLKDPASYAAGALLRNAARAFIHS